LMAARTIIAMAIAPELLAILICPRCKSPVRITAAGAALGCARCRVAYPIVEDIPVMIFEEAAVWNPDAGAIPS
jgi:uncharacterized protein